MVERKEWIKPVMWLVAILVVNSLWSTVASQEAPNEINSPSQTQKYREVIVASVAELDRPLPARMVVSFSAENTDTGSVSYSILLNNQTKVAEWSGNLGDDVPQWRGALKPGTYIIETVVDDGIVAQQELFIQPFAAYQLEGHIVLSLMLIGIAFAEQGIRSLANKFKQPLDTQTQERTPYKEIQSEAPEFDHLSENDSPWREPLR